jgi:microcystin-dependent protein
MATRTALAPAPVMLVAPAPAPGQTMIVAPAQKSDTKLYAILVVVIIILVYVLLKLYTMSLLDIGMVSYFPTAVPPINWLFCDGRAVPQAMYPKLYEAITTTYGASTDATQFTLPDLRGMFVRGIDPSGTKDAVRTLSTVQSATAILPDIGEYKIPATTQWVPNATNTHNIATGIINYDKPVTVSGQQYLPTRPQNIAMYAYIKYQ